MYAEDAVEAIVERSLSHDTRSEYNNTGIESVNPRGL